MGALGEVQSASIFLAHVFCLYNIRTENLVQAISHISDIPLVKVGGLVGWRADAGLEGSINKILEASSLLLGV